MICMGLIILNIFLTIFIEVFIYEEFFEKLMEECEIRNLSANTARTYTDNIKPFLLDVVKHSDHLELNDTRLYILKRSRECISSEYCNNINISSVIGITEESALPMVDYQTKKDEIKILDNR